MGLAIAGIVIGGCASPPDATNQAAQTTQSNAAADRVTMFSAGPAGGVPQGWAPMVLFKNKKRTDYKLIAGPGKPVLRAYANSASSGLMQQVNIDPYAQPWLHWRWKLRNLNQRIEEAHERMEDTPARIILGFDGDKGNLPFTEQILFETAKLVTGYDFPYATLMYEWHGKSPVDSVRRSDRTSRIRMLVVDTGVDKAGQWREFSRNIVEDFEKAYGEKPGKLVAVGVITDSDHTGEIVETWYGDIQLAPNRQIAAR